MPNAFLVAYKQTNSRKQHHSLRQAGPLGDAERLHLQLLCQWAKNQVYRCIDAATASNHLWQGNICIHGGDTCQQLKDTHIHIQALLHNVVLGYNINMYEIAFNQQQKVIAKCAEAASEGETHRSMSVRRPLCPAFLFMQQVRHPSKSSVQQVLFTLTFTWRPHILLHSLVCFLKVTSKVKQQRML